MEKALILLLCSDPVLRSVMREVLENAGHVVEPAGELGVAVDRIERTPMDLLVLSPYIENISGHDAALYLRTKQNGLKVLMVGGLMKDDRLQYRDSLQALEYFPEPYTAEQFLKKVAEILARTHQNPSRSNQ